MTTSVSGVVGISPRNPCLKTGFRYGNTIRKDNSVVFLTLKIIETVSFLALMQYATDTISNRNKLTHVVARNESQGVCMFSLKCQRGGHAKICPCLSLISGSYWQSLVLLVATLLHFLSACHGCLCISLHWVLGILSCTPEDRSHITQGFTHLHYELTLTNIPITIRKITDTVTVLFGFLLL